MVARATFVDQAIGVLNGVIGDYLHARESGLATELMLVGAAELSARARRLVVLVHGLACTEAVWQMAPSGSELRTTNYGLELERSHDLQPLFVRYNSGRPIRDNGELLAAALTALAERQELDEIVLVGFSMGGLVIRHAVHAARRDGAPWLNRVRHVFYIGTPHQGSPWERAGRALTTILSLIPDPFTRLAADIADVRSVGIKELGGWEHPNDPSDSSVHEIRQHLIASFVGGAMGELWGDGLVPLASGTAGLHEESPIPPHVTIDVLPHIAHVDLARHPDVLGRIQHHLTEGGTP